MAHTAQGTSGPRVRTRARVAGRGAVQSAVVISGCLASVSRLRAGPLCNPLAALAGPFGVAGLGPPCNPLAFRKGVAGLVLRGALHLFHSRAQEYGLDAGHA